MFCCLTGKDKPEQAEHRELAVNLKNKKPLDFMKDPIPLSLSDQITFNFGREHKWTYDALLSNRTLKREDHSALKNKIVENQRRLSEAKEEEARLKREISARRA